VAVYLAAVFVGKKCIGNLHVSFRNHFRNFTRGNATVAHPSVSHMLAFPGEITASHGS
jgi:hypothetical protein